jgi:DNA-binding FadR family transcriptional regulator
MSEPGSLIRTLSGRQAARNYHSYVINEVGAAIVGGAMAVGSILPGDTEMMERFGVSRTVLREALKTLEAKGLVEARAKVGTRVLPQARWNLFDRQVLLWVLESGPSPAFLDSFGIVRRSLQLEAAGLAARHREAEHIRLLRYWQTQRQVMSHQPEPFAMAEFELFRVICEASANPFIRAASGLVEFGVAIDIGARLTAGQAPAEGLAPRDAAEHLALMTALEAGEPQAARAAMQALLDRAAEGQPPATGAI